MFKHVFGNKREEKYYSKSLNSCAYAAILWMPVIITSQKSYSELITLILCNK